MTTRSRGQLYTNRTWGEVAAQLKEECDKWSERIESFTLTSYRDAQREGNVRVNLLIGGEWRFLECDRFKHETNGPQRNLLALVQVVQARRKESQRGIEDIGTQAQKAFALPDPLDPYVILRVSRKASSEELRAAFRQRAKETHPSRMGGSRDEYERVRAAADLLAARMI